MVLPARAPARRGMLWEYKKTTIEPAQYSVMILYGAYIVDESLLDRLDKQSVGYPGVFLWE